MKLKRTLISTAILAAMFGLAGCNSDDDNSKSGAPSLDTTLTQYVNPLIGTGADGHTFPGAVVPYGLVQLLLIPKWKAGALPQVTSTTAN